MTKNITPNPENSALKLTEDQKSDWLNFRSSSATVTFSKEEMTTILGLSDPALASIKEKISEAANPSNQERDIFILANIQCQEEGETEFDDNCIISDGDDNGAYVGSFTWIDFSGTDLDKNNKQVYIAMSSQGFWNVTEGWVDCNDNATHFKSKEDVSGLSYLISPLISCIEPLEMPYDVNHDEFKHRISINDLIEYISSSVRSHGVIDRAKNKRDEFVLDIFKDYFEDDELFKSAAPAIIDLYNREVDCEENAKSWRSGSFYRVEVNC